MGSDINLENQSSRLFSIRYDDWFLREGDEVFYLAEDDLIHKSLAARAKYLGNEDAGIGKRIRLLENYHSSHKEKISENSSILTVYPDEIYWDVEVPISADRLRDYFYQKRKLSEEMTEAGSISRNL